MSQLCLGETNNNVISTAGKKSIVICFTQKKPIDTLLRRYDIGFF